MLDCSLCTELFNLETLDMTPRLLACGHTYCHGCLVKVYNPTSHLLTCPECRRDQKYERLDDIAVDLQLIKMINENSVDNQVDLKIIFALNLKSFLDFKHLI